MAEVTEIETLRFPPFKNMWGLSDLRAPLDTVLGLSDGLVDPSGSIVRRTGVFKREYGTGIDSIVLEGVTYAGGAWWSHDTGGNDLFREGVEINSAGDIGVRNVVEFSDGYVYAYGRLAAFRADTVVDTTYTPTISSSLTGTTGQVPSDSDFLLSANERLFAFVGSAETPGATNGRIYWSDLFDPTTWQGSHIEMPHDVATFVDVKVYGDAILIFTRDGAYILSGFDEDTFALYRVFSTQCLDGTVQVDGSNAYFANKQGAWVFDGASTSRISLPAFDAYPMNTYPPTTCSMIFEGRYYLSKPGLRTYVLDLDTKAWSVLGVGFSGLASTGDGSARGTGVVFSDFIANSTQGLYYAFGGIHEDGPTASRQNIPFQFSTAWIGADDLGFMNRLRQVDLVVSSDNINAAVSGDTFTVNLYVDGELLPTTSWSFDLLHGVTLVDAVLRTLSESSVNWQVCRIEFVGDVGTIGVSVDRIEAQISRRPHQRGRVRTSG